MPQETDNQRENSPAATSQRQGNHVSSAGLAGLAPGALWLLVFFFVPLAFILVVSFLSRDDLGQIQGSFTFENYKRLAGFELLGFEWLYPAIIGRSLLLAAFTTVLCVGLATPVSFFIARLSSKRRNAALALVVIPFWTNLLVRTYAWQTLLQPGSWLSSAAAWLGWVPPGEGLYPGLGAVCICTVCDYLPFMVLPLYASVERIDWTLAEAARDLGANDLKTFWHGVLPQIRPGLAAGAALVFLPATGQFVIPDLLGGAKTTLLGNALQQQFGSSQDWPFGAALAMLGLVTVLLVSWLLRRSTGKSSACGTP